ncbi:hypothetical protein [Roseivivax marinus]|nr:hypothetical protein [Roseivivax marinus]
MDDDSSTEARGLQRSRCTVVDGVPYLDPEQLAAEYATSAGSLLRTAGLAGSDVANYRSERVQERLREIVEIIDMHSRGLQETSVSHAWYRLMPLPGMGGKRAVDLVAEGHAGFVRHEIDRAFAGDGYA